MLKRCPFNKLKYFFNCFSLHFNCYKNILFHNCRTNHFRELNQIFSKSYLPKWNGNTNVKRNFMLMASMWYETNKEDIEENLAHLVILAKIALERGDYDRAREILHLGLQISETHKMYSGVHYLYDILIAMSISQGNITQAQELLVTAIEKLKIWGFSEDHYNVIDFKLRLARIYSTRGQNSLAQIGFINCLDIQKNKVINGDTTEKTGILYINVLFWYGVHLIRNNKYIEAKDMIHTAYEFSTKIKGLSPKQELIILYTLSDLNVELGDLDIALQSMLNAIIIGKGIGSVDLPICYLKLGNIYEKIGFKEQAILSYKQALKSAKLFGYIDIVSDAEEALHGILDEIN